ncbi:MAG: hypothetical protein CMI09_08935 [Oceanospirillaceae bacterium]|nr:hypothetical protein [Oceanospirillaceae bacterium]
MHFLIIDDHNLFADALSLTLSARFNDLEVTQTSEARQALEWLSQGQRFDLIILDLAMPGIDGLGFIESYTTLYQDTSILVCSGGDDPKALQRLQQLGITAYLSKSQPADEAEKAVHAALTGQPYYPVHLQEALEREQAASTIQPGKPIPERQLAILRLIRVGHSNQEIADLLHISTNTVKTHIRLLYDRLDARNRQECLLKAEQQQLL